MTAVLTILIVVRLLQHKKRIGNLLGPDHANQYTSIAAMMVESALPYSFANVVIAIMLGVNSPWQNAFANVPGQFTVSAVYLVSCHPGTDIFICVVFPVHCAIPYHSSHCPGPSLVPGARIHGHKGPRSSGQWRGRWTGVVSTRYRLHRGIRVGDRLQGGH